MNRETVDCRELVEKITRFRQTCAAARTGYEFAVGRVRITRVAGVSTRGDFFRFQSPVYVSPREIYIFKRIFIFFFKSFAQEIQSPGRGDRCYEIFSKDARESGPLHSDVVCTDRPIRSISTVHSYGLRSTVKHIIRTLHDVPSIGV